MLSLKCTLWQLDSAIIVNYLLSFSTWATACKSCSYLQNSSPEVITLPLHWALLLSIGRSVVSKCAYSVNITEWALAWPHQYNTDKRLLAICLSTVPHPSHLSPEKIYSKENWLGWWNENVSFLTYGCHDNGKRPHNVRIVGSVTVLIFMTWLMS